ncbi:MAG: OB-fold nucleic acid binding domain-containing protein [Cellulomonadaceae bacterium]
MSVRTALRGLLSSQEEVAAHEERQVAQAQSGTTRANVLVPRRRASVAGVVRSVVLRPAERARAVEAELYDGSGSVDLVWLGRRQIPGIEPGRRMCATGLVVDVKGRHIMFNPRYELLPGADDAR